MEFLLNLENKKRSVQKRSVIVKSNQVKEQYNSMAFFYDVLYANYDLSEFENEFINEHKELLASVSNEAKILDSSCGKGVQAVALKKQGFNVTATDISQEMIKLTQIYAKDNNLSIPLKRLAWSELPLEFDDIFDIVFCWGNSISHSLGKEDMLKNLSSFHKIVKDGGKVVIHTRNWEKILKENQRFQSLPIREYNNKKYIPLYIWNLSGFDKINYVEIIFVKIMQDGSTSCTLFRLDFVPFSHIDLIDRLNTTGFKIFYDNYDINSDFYYIVAEK